MAYDAVVVGSGINGMAAAVHLSRKGWKVVVVERSDGIGGAVRTEEVTLPGFRHDLCAMNLSMFAGSPFFAEHGALLQQCGLDLISVDRPFASVFPAGADTEWLGVERGLEQTLAHVTRASERDALRWVELSERFDREAPHIFALLGSPVPSWAAAKVLLKMGRALGVRGMADTARLLVSSSRSWLEERFESHAVRAMLATWGLHLDFAPDIAGGALFPYLEAMVGQRFGMTLGKGGAGGVIHAMAEAVRRQGGVIRTQSEVARIHVAQGRAQSVELTTGERFEADRAVIANVHPRDLYGKLLGAGLPSDSKRAAALRPGLATMMIHLALDRLPGWLAGVELQRYAYVHLAPSMDHMAAVYNEAMAGLLPREPVLVVGQPTAHDPSRAPEGKHVLWVQVRVLPFAPRGDAAGDLQGQSWDDYKEAYADRVIDILERYAPGIRAAVLARNVSSPVDLVRLNPNLVEGDSLSGSHHLDQFFLFRPAFGRSRWTSGVERLYNIGASTWPGAGTGAGSGYLLGKQLSR